MNLQCYLLLPLKVELEEYGATDEEVASDGDVLMLIYTTDLWNEKLKM